MSPALPAISSKLQDPKLIVLEARARMDFAKKDFLEYHVALNYVELVI